MPRSRIYWADEVAGNESAKTTINRAGKPARLSLQRSDPASRGRLDWRQRDRLTGYAFIAPSFVGFLVFVAGPVLAVFWYSFHEFDLLRGSFEWIGSENYRRLLDDDEVRRVAVNTLIFIGGTVPLRIALGLGLAILLNRRIKGIGFFRSIYFLPTVVTLVAWTIVWNFLLQADGGLNGVLTAFGIDGPTYLRSPGWAMFWLIIVLVLKGTGVTMVLFLAALQNVPDELLDASKVDGATPIGSFRHVTLPFVTPFVFLALIHATISSAKAFELILLMTGGGPGLSTTVLVYYIYVVGFQFFEQGYASALAVTLFAFTLGLTILQFAARKRWVYGEV